MDDFNVKGHIIVGLLLAPFVTHTGIGVVLILFGSILPDIDHPGSTIGRYNPLHFIRGAVKHRGKCHTLGGVVLLSLPFYLLDGWTTVGFVLIGAIGHLVADKVYSWFPKKRKFKLRIW